MSNTSVGTGRDHTNEIRRLSTLLEVSQALSGVLNLKAALQSVLDLLERRHQVVGGTIFLLDAGHARAARRGDGRHPAGGAAGPAAAGRRHHRTGHRHRQAGGGAARQPGAGAGGGRRRARARPRAHLHRGPDRGRPAAGRDARGRAHLQAGSRLPALARVLPGRRLDDRAGAEAAAHASKPIAAASPRRTSTCATSCATSTRSAASSATAPRSSRSTSRSRRWRAPTPRC